MPLNIYDLTFPLGSEPILHNTGLYVEPATTHPAAKAYYYDVDEKRFMTQVSTYKSDIDIRLEDVETVIAFIAAPSLEQILIGLGYAST